MIVVDLAESTDPTALAEIGEAVAADPGIAAVQPPLINASGDTAVIMAQPTTSPQDERDRRDGQATPLRRAAGAPPRSPAPT